jgi:hypothetical protein
VTWLDPLRAALDGSAQPVTFFLRDDDAGWDDEQLVALLDLVAERGLPLDLAVIPAALRPALAERLLERVASGLVGLHQHGLAHLNHELDGRKCEFGPARSRRVQRRDIAAGRSLLEDLLGPHLDPIFTPPWNRCTRATGECLAEIGFLAISRESHAEPLEVPGLGELPVSVDWFAKRKGVRLGAGEVGMQLAHAAARQAPVGVMFHHAEMDGNERTRAAELLDLLAGHASARVESMRALVPTRLAARP